MHRVNERNSEQRDDMEEQMPRALGTAHDARGVRDEAPSMAISWEPVPRMPRTRQVSSTLTPSLLSGSGKCRNGVPTLGILPHGLVTSMSPTGAPLAIILRAVIRQPPSTRSALPDPAIPVCLGFLMSRRPPYVPAIRHYRATARPSPLKAASREAWSARFNAPQ
jgi:hypothetical protein